MFVSSEGQARVLTAARGLVRRRGYADVSLRQIAAAARYSPAGLYAHFAGLDAILEALADTVRGELAQRLEEAATARGDGRAQLISIGTAYVAFALEHPNEFELLFRHTRSRKRSPADPSPSSFDLLRRIVRRIAPPAGADEIDTACMGLWATAHGLATLRISHLADLSCDWDRWSRQILQSQVEALSCDRPSSS